MLGNCWGLGVVVVGLPNRSPGDGIIALFARDRIVHMLRLRFPAVGLSIVRRHPANGGISEGIRGP